MLNKPIRVILDTNLWISFLITKNFSQLNSLILSQQVTLIFSDELLDEFTSVIKRPKFHKYFSKADIILLLEVIDLYAEFVTVQSVTTICRDEKDNFLLSLAKDGHADFLLTGDSDLLDLQEHIETQITTIANFYTKFL